MNGNALNKIKIFLVESQQFHFIIRCKYGNQAIKVISQMYAVPAEILSNATLASSFFRNKDISTEVSTKHFFRFAITCHDN
jgi:hypothetical protein